MVGAHVFRMVRRGFVKLLCRKEKRFVFDPFQVPIERLDVFAGLSLEVRLEVLLGEAFPVYSGEVAHLEHLFLLLGHVISFGGGVGTFHLLFGEKAGHFHFGLLFVLHLRGFFLSLRVIPCLLLVFREVLPDVFFFLAGAASPLEKEEGYAE